MLTLENLIGGANKEALKIAKLMVKDAKRIEAKTMRIVIKDEKLARKWQ